MTAPDASPQPPPAPRERPRSAVRAAGVALARARFLLLVGGFLALVAAWPLARNYWDRIVRTPPPAAAVSPDTEYWCPMCPGVVSDWPTKCPVCSMALVRRRKGEMTPLPDGVVARVQLSPYRVQLAGIRTAPVEYRPLDYEVTAAGLLEAPSGPSAPASALILTGEVFERNAVMLTAGQEGRVACDAAPGDPAAGRIVEVNPPAAPGAGWRVRVRVENGRGELRPGLYAAATFRIPVSRVDGARRVEAERWRDTLAAGLLADPWAAGAGTLLDAGVRQAAARTGLVPGVPEAAVVDTGTRQVVYVETMPGVYDAVEVRLGRRCGEFYPVWSGVEPGQRVVTAGAVLLDAETRLNPSVAASYFGAGSRDPGRPQPAAGSASPDDAQLIAKQKICPVTGEPLDSMGGPVRLVVEGRVVFICCKGCETALRKKPAEYLPKLPK